MLHAICWYCQKNQAQEFIKEGYDEYPICFDCLAAKWKAGKLKNRLCINKEIEYETDRDYSKEL